MEDYHEELLEAKRVHTLTLKRWAKAKAALLSDKSQGKQDAFQRLTNRLEKAEQRLDEALAAFPNKPSNPKPKGERDMGKKKGKKSKKAKAKQAAVEPEVEETEEEEEVEEAEEEPEEEDEPEEDEEEEEDEDEEPAPKKKAKAKKEKAKGPGVIASIVEFIENSKKGITKDQIVDKLAKRFPDRKPESMKNTVNVQVPNKLKTDKDITVVRDDKGRYRIK